MKRTKSRGITEEQKDVPLTLYFDFFNLSGVVVNAVQLSWNLKYESHSCHLDSDAE